jgi:hypothetical protein
VVFVIEVVDGRGGGVVVELGGVGVKVAYGETMVGVAVAVFAGGLPQPAIIKMNIVEIKRIFFIISSCICLSLGLPDRTDFPPIMSNLVSDLSQIRDIKNEADLPIDVGQEKLVPHLKILYNE